MKKIFTLIAVVIMSATSAMAQFEVGGIVGGLMGASAKYWFNDQLALQGDLAVGLTRGAGSTKGYSWDAGLYDFTLNPNALYHFDLPQNFKVYTGGGLSIGLVNSLEGGSSNSVMGKFGLNAVGGVSYDLQQFPLVFAIDFRPGYGLGFRDGGTMNYFDWKLALAVRYRL